MNYLPCLIGITAAIGLFAALGAALQHLVAGLHIAGIG